MYNKNVLRILVNLNGQMRRYFHQNRRLNAKTYEGEGKTTAHILNQDTELGLMIDGYSQVGFRLNNNVTVLGSMAIFPRSVISWTVDDISKINEESFSLFTIIEPQPDIIVLGIGDRPKQHDFFKTIIPISKKLHLTFEVLPTEAACPTFNFLNSEGRFVAGLMIPPKVMHTTNDDEMKTKLRYQGLYRTDWL